MRIGRRCLQAGVVTLCVMGAAPHASAQLPTSGPTVTKSHDNQQNFPFGDNSPCTGEVVAGNGHMNSKTTEKVNAATYEFQYVIHQNGKGVGAASGHQYQFDTWNFLTFRTSTTNFSVTTQARKHIIRVQSGQSEKGDDFFARETLTCGPRGCTPGPITSEPTCR